MKIQHADPTFTGCAVEAAREFWFADGTAEVDDLTPTEVAAISVVGWTITDIVDAPDEPVDEAPKQTRKRPPREISDEVPDSEMEKPEPTIG
ncbi:MAG: hypothetical protein INR72_18070 [Williamsia herbipolensis]|nr:hypothetical protein [Williamsia herbipolensis]